MVASLVPVGTVPGSYTRLEVSSCPSCQGLNTFSAVLCTLTPSEDGKEEDSLDEDYVADQLLVNKTVVTGSRNCRSQTTEPWPWT